MYYKTNHSKSKPSLRPIALLGQMIQEIPSSLKKHPKTPRDAIQSIPIKKIIFSTSKALKEVPSQNPTIRKIKSQETTPNKILTTARQFYSPFTHRSKTSRFSYLKFIKSQTPFTLKLTTGTSSPQFFSPRNLNTRESQRSLRIKSKNRLQDDRNWRRIINSSNGIDCQPMLFVNYKAFVGKGNNSSLINKIFSSRNWWSFSDTKERCNFVWTQWKDKECLASLQGLPQKNHRIDQQSTQMLKSLNTFDTGAGLISGSSSYISLGLEKFDSESARMYNKLEHNQKISNKKDLFLILRSYYLSVNINIHEKVPLTFHISQGELDPEFLNFSEKFHVFEQLKQSNPHFQNIWIIKPGEFTNRGQGIKVSKVLSEITSLISSPDHTYILQKYIENPLLFCKRKFDIRCYALVTSINGLIQAYFYQDGYLRTTSQEYSTKDVNNLFVHLTNDAIQKHSKEYGKFENGNKLSYAEFQAYLDRRYPEKKVNFVREVVPGIKEFVKDTILASYRELDPYRRANTMEIFGYDFMLDRKMKPWLIEVNTNPCLELASKYLAVLIPNMLENAFRIVVDTVFPPPIGEFIDFSQKNRFELIFHELVDGSK